MTRRLPILAVASCFLVVAMFASASAGVLLFDSFDEQGANFPPVQWTPAPDRPGDYEASSGNYVFSFLPESERVMHSDLLNVTYPNLSARTQVRVTGNQSAAGLLVRSQTHIGDKQRYLGLAGWFETLGGTNLFIVRSNPGDTFDTLAFTPLPGIDVRTEDVMLQFDVFDDKLELWGWRPGEPMPEFPLDVIDDIYSDGIFGLYARNAIDGNSVGTFRFVQVEDQHITMTIPEPSTLTLTALTLVGLYVCGRRR